MKVEGKDIKKPSEIAQAMNDYFFKNLRDNILPQPNPPLPNEYVINESATQFRFEAINVVDAKKALGKMKTLFGFASDGISSHCINIAFPVISQLLCSIFNFSINTGKFPDSWKTARVVPIFMQGCHLGFFNPKFHNFGIHGMSLGSKFWIE